MFPTVTDARSGLAWQGMAGPGRASSRSVVLYGLARLGQAWHGSARQVQGAWFGRVRFGLAGLGKDKFKEPGSAGLGWAWQGSARQVQVQGTRSEAQLCCVVAKHTFHASRWSRMPRFSSISSGISVQPSTVAGACLLCGPPPPIFHAGRWSRVQRKL